MRHVMYDGYIVPFMILLAALVAFGCQSPTGNVVRNETIRIGFIAPLSGPFVDWGSSIQDGVIIATEDTKHQFSVDYQDDACDAQKATTIAHKFFDIDDIHIVIGLGCDDSLLAIAPIAAQSDAALFSTGFLRDEVFSEYPQVINLATQISTEARVIAAHIARSGHKRVAILHGTNSFGQEYGRRLPEFLNEDGVQVTSVSPTALDTTDFRTTIAKMMRDSPDAIFIHQSEISVGTFVKQLREMGYTTPVFGEYGAESQSSLAASGGAMEGMVYSYPLNAAADSEATRIFEQRYARRFGRPPTASSMFVYDGMMLLDKAMDACSPQNATCVTEFFKGYGTYHGISGTMAFNKDGSLTREFGIKAVEDGAFVWVKRSPRGSDT